MSKKLRIKCLVLDHDDTVVKSSPEIHYPSFVRAMEKINPERKITYQQFIEWNFTPGFSAMCTDILGFTEEDIAYQEKCWKEGSSSKIPSMYEGIAEMLHRYVANGGKVCVSSHSAKENITRDYKAAGAPIPEHIFDYACKRPKPDPYALEEIIKIYGFQPEEILMVDDLKPGYDMAKAVGVQFACAGWSDNQTPMIQDFMKRYSDYYPQSVEALEALLYQEEA